MPFSVLMPIYIGTKHTELISCLDSLSSQSLKPDEILVLQDGPVSDEIASYLKLGQSELPIRLIEYPINRGIGTVLREGLPKCTHDLVARVDSDDRCLPNRFQRQVNFLEQHSEISVVGGILREYYSIGQTHRQVLKSCPNTLEAIIAIAKKRNPLNHPTVMFRKADVIACGSYQHCDLFEDYYLWARMIQSGYRLTNLPEILVETDIDLDYFLRRGGLEYMKKEIALCNKLMSIGFFSRVDACAFLVTRLPVRVLPSPIRQLFYRKMLRNNSK